VNSVHADYTVYIDKDGQSQIPLPKTLQDFFTPADLVDCRNLGDTVSFSTLSTFEFRCALYAAFTTSYMTPPDAGQHPVPLFLHARAYNREVSPTGDFAGMREQNLLSSSFSVEDETVFQSVSC